MADTKQNVFERLLLVQKKAHAPREISGKFGKGRSAEQILEAYKPVCNDNGLYLFTSDTVERFGERNYITATATVVNVTEPSEMHSATASAWEGGVPLSNSGNEILDTSQVSGKTSSYAKKYALQNLFAIDDNKDADQDTEDVVYNSTKKESPDDVLARAKKMINETLEAQDYKTAVSKKAFITKVLEKSTIETLDEADLVMDALENEQDSGDLDQLQADAAGADKWNA